MFSKGKVKREPAWNFVRAEKGSGDKGINNPGIHSYSSDPIKNLAREICQNSLDAAKTADSGETLSPVRLEIDQFFIPKEQFPDRARLKEVYKSQIQYYSKIKEKDQTEVNFFNNALEMIDKEYIECLRISDFNTRGLTGSNKTSGGDWHNLVKGVGISDKEATAGGSFGIGKHAAYAISKLYQVFFSTIDIEQNEAFQGVTLLSSFENEETYYDGRGYYGFNDNFAQIKHWQSLDPEFKREKDDYGTDIFIVGTELYDDWQESVIIAVLENFMISILEKKLTVKVADKEIDHNTAEQLIIDLSDKAENGYVYEYFLTYKKALAFNRVHHYTLMENDDVELHLLFNDDVPQDIFNRTVSMTRKNGMKIFDKKKNPRVEFSGILILRGDKVNQFFRELETPQHDQWSVDMVKSKSKTQAKKYRKELYDFIREKINEFIQENLSDELNAEGLSDFLPEIDPEEGSGKIEEALSKYKVNILKQSGRKQLKQEEEIGEQVGTETQKRGGDPDASGNKNIPGKGNQPGKGGGANPTIPGVESDNDFEAIDITPTKPKHLKILKNKNGYRVRVQLESPVNDLNLEFKYLGETGRGICFSISEVDADVPHQLKENAVRLNPKIPQDNFTFNIKTFSNENWSLEVVLNEIQS